MGYRKFNGKNFELETHAFTKREAQEKADRLRRRGHKARVVKGTGVWKGKYAIYVRGG